MIVGIDAPGLNEYIGSFCQVCEEQGVTVYIDYAGDFIPDFAPAVAEKAIPYCNIVCITGEEMKSSVQGYFQVLFDQNPQSVGGALPGDDFYYLGQ